jgi:hypothetical protein
MGCRHRGKRDATRPAETEKMQVNVDDYLLEVHPGQVAHQRPAETPKDRCDASQPSDDRHQDDEDPRRALRLPEPSGNQRY